MEQRPEQETRLARAARARSATQERHAERVAEIAGKQAQLKGEAQERREQRDKQRKST